MLTQPEAVVGVHSHVAQADHGEGLGLVRRPDVDEHVLHGGGLSLAHGLLHDHALHAVLEADVTGTAHGQPHAAHGHHPQEALLFHGHHDKADMVHMRRQHDALAVRVRAALFANEIAQCIAADGIDMVLHKRLHGVGHAGLAPGRAVQIHQLPDEFKHRKCTSPFISPKMPWPGGTAPRYPTRRIR